MGIVAVRRSNPTGGNFAFDTRPSMVHLLTSGEELSSEVPFSNHARGNPLPQESQGHGEGESSVFKPFCC